MDWHKRNKRECHHVCNANTCINNNNNNKARMIVVIMWLTTCTYSAMLKDRDYDVTPHIILILSLTLTQNARGGGRRRFARCIVDIVGEECEVYCEYV